MGAASEESDACVGGTRIRTQVRLILFENLSKGLGFGGAQR